MPPVAGKRVEPAGVPDGAKLPTARQLYQQAVVADAAYDSYIARLTRREPIKGKNEDEILIFYFRKQPWSVRFKWLAGEGRGREVLYVKDRYDNKLHTLLSVSDGLLAGQKLSLSLDSPLIKSTTRHPITDAGIGAGIRRFGKLLDACDRNDFSMGKVKVLGVQPRPDYDVPLVLVEQTLPTGADPDVPRGGRRLIGFDPQLHLPVLSILYDEQNKEVEYDRFDRLQLGVHLNDTDFDADKMGKRPVKRK